MRRQGGFTLIEVLVVVGIIAVLAMIAVPAFFGEKSKATARSEVAAMFAEFRIRQEQYSLENGVYLSTGGSEAAKFPTAPSPNLQALGTPPTAWTTLRFTPPSLQVRCSYVCIAGAPGDPVGADAAAFGFVAPNANWFYLLAECDMDGDNTLNGKFFSSSVDNTIAQTNPTK